jgi:hypothetical protein
MNAWIAGKGIYFNLAAYQLRRACDEALYGHLPLGVEGISGGSLSLSQQHNTHLTPHVQEHEQGARWLS